MSAILTLCEKCGKPAEPAKRGPDDISMDLCFDCWRHWWDMVADQRTAYQASQDFTKVYLLFLATSK